MKSRNSRASISRWGIAAVAAITVLISLPGPLRADLAIETETARLPAQGGLTLSAAFEYQTASEGEEYAVPLALEYGLTDRLELMIEPVPYTSIQPNTGSSASGLGDTETTLTYLVFDETPNMPAIAVAGEVKIPTARDLQIGSKEFDYRHLRDRQQADRRLRSAF